jgi:hypothetical protein
MRLFLPSVLYTVWCLSQSYARTHNCKKKLVGKKERNKKEKEKTQRRKPQHHRLGTNVRVRGFKAGLLARSQSACGSATSRFSVDFFGPRANAGLLPKLHVALHDSHATFPMVTLKISPCTNVTLTWARSPCLWGIWVRESYTEKTK